MKRIGRALRPAGSPAPKPATVSSVVGVEAMADPRAEALRTVRTADGNRVFPCIR